MKRKQLIMSVLLMVFLILSTTGCSNIVVSNSNSENSKETMSEQEIMNNKCGDIHRIWINNNVGTITINKTDGDDVKVRMKKKVQGQDKKEVKEVIDTITPKVELMDGRLEIEAVTREGRSDIWSWLSSNHNRINVTIDLYIDIPKSFADFTIINVIGDIAINDLSGSFNVENMTGNINMNNDEFNGSNHIMLTTGNIDMNAVLMNTASLEATDSIGNVNLVIPSSSKISLNTSVVTGVINGNFSGIENKSGIGGLSFKGELNGGGNEVALKSITGNVTVNSR